MIDRFERFSFSIFEIFRCWHKIAADVMTDYGLKGPHAIYLIAMRREENGVTAARLCDLCNRDKADVSRAIAQMVEKGLVQREGGSQYRALLKLTESGLQAADNVSECARVAVEHAGGGISDADREVFYAVLESITVNLQNLSKEGLPE